MKTGVNAIDSDDEEENAKQEKKMNYKKLDMKKVNGVEDDPECGQMDDEGNMITGHGVEVFSLKKVVQLARLYRVRNQLPISKRRPLKKDSI